MNVVADMVWKKIKLKRVLTKSVRNGYSPVCSDVANGKWVLGLGALNGNGFDATQIKPAPINDRRVEEFLLNPGDFLISRSNTLNKVGHSALFRGQIENCSYPDLMMRFRVDKSKINPEFLEVFLKSPLAVHYFQRSASGTSASMVKIGKKVVEDLQVPIPPLHEQIAIADLLSTWDTAIEKIERLIAAKEKRLDALRQQYFKPNSYKNELWKCSKLRKFLKQRKEKAVPSEDLPLYSLTIENGVTAKTERYNRDFLVKDIESKQYKIVHPGDIVFNPANLRWGAIARSEVKHNVTISPIYEVLQITKDSIDPDFITQALTCPRQIGIFATKTEGTLIERMAVKIDAFLLTEILHPIEIEIQKSIAATLNIAHQEINLNKKQIEAFRKQKRGLMQKLLTGQWRAKIKEK
jgi:type I restriction enzyme, S subunit